MFASCDGDMGGEEVGGGAEEGAERHEAGAEDAEEELGGSPPDYGNECVCSYQKKLAVCGEVWYDCEREGNSWELGG